MAEKKADTSGVPSKEVRQAIAGQSFLVILQVKYEDWREEQANKRRQAEAAKARAVLFPKAPSKPKPAPKPKAAPKVAAVPVAADPANPQKRKRLARALILALLFLLLLASLLAWVWFLNRPSIVATSLPPAIPPTNSAAVADPTSLPPRVAYLRVETLELDTQYGIWRRMPGIGIILDGPGGEDWLRQVTEEMVTEDGFLVAATTFEVRQYHEESYWVWVDETSLPAGCAVWQPRFVADADTGIEIRPWVIVRLFSSGVLNTTVVKFQFVCGLEVTASPTTVSPVNTPVPSTDVPPTNPPPTDPQPTDPPPPTPEPTEVDCNCETPESPVPTPEFESTPTPTR